MRILYLNGRPVSGFRHATRRDIIAVLLASAVACLPPLLLLAGAPLKIVAAVGAECAIAYLWTCADVIGSFLLQGPLFTIRAIAMMMLLDYVRVACAVTSLWLVAKKWSPQRLLQSDTAL
jgi:hypothetical protein